MTLQQMRYAITLAEYSSFNEAAKNLFVSQPTLSNAIRELEEELGVMLFVRTKKGVEASPDGIEFLESARQIIAASDQLLHWFRDTHVMPPMRFSVSALRYGFVAHVFTQLIASLPNSYDLIFHETSYQQVVQDVTKNVSEIGVLNTNSVNIRYLPRQIKDNHLIFTPLYETKSSILVSANHPLSRKSSVSFEDLIPYPYLSYEYEKPALSTLVGTSISFEHRPQRLLRAQDRSTLNWLIRNTDGYAIGNGLMDEDFQGGLITVPLNADSDAITVGWICKEDAPLSDLAQQFVTLLKEEVKKRLELYKGHAWLSD